MCSIKSNQNTRTNEKKSKRKNHKNKRKEKKYKAISEFLVKKNACKLKSNEKKKIYKAENDKPFEMKFH